jgi:hypothetical protein
VWQKRFCKPLQTQISNSEASKGEMPSDAPVAVAFRFLRLCARARKRQKRKKEDYTGGRTHRNHAQSLQEETTTVAKLSREEEEAKLSRINIIVK